MNLNKLKKNRDEQKYFVPNDHYLAQLIKLSALDDTSDKVTFVSNSSRRALNKRGTLRTAYGPSLGDPKHDFFNENVDEYWSLISGRHTYKSEVSWRDHRPVRIVSHPYTANNIPILDGKLPTPVKYELTGMANAFIIVKTKDLFSMYYEYILEREMKRIPNPRDVEGFVARYILPSMVPDFMNLSLLNIHYYQHEKITSFDNVNNLPFFQVPTNLPKHTHPKRIRSYTSRSFDEWLSHFPFMADGIIDSLYTTGIPMYGRYHTFSVMAAISTLEILADCVPDRVIKAETAVISEYNIAMRRIKADKYVPKDFLKRLEYVGKTLNKRR